MTAYLPPQPIPWVRPDTRPWRGTSAEAMRLLIRAGYPGDVVRAQFAALAAGQCRLRTIRQGEHFAAMLFGRDEIEADVVAQTDRWPAVSSRAALVCEAESGAVRYQLWRPDACGNFSERIVPLGLPPWGEAFGPAVPPLAGITDSVYGGAYESASVYGSAYSAFAGGWAAGIGGTAVVAPGAVSFTAPAPLIREAAFERARWCRERWHRRFRRIGVPTPPAHVPEPSAGALLLTAIVGMAAIMRRWR